MSTDETTAPRSRRERSARYPGVPLAESVELCRFVDELGLDGLTAADIAAALGYTNVKTNTFSARLSAARQFGLLRLQGEGYHLAPLARAILHPVDPSEVPQLYRRAFLEPTLYAELAEQFAGKRVPEAAILANVLYHNHHIIASAKLAAAEAFLASARTAGALDDDQILRPSSPPSALSSAPVPAPPSVPQRSIPEVRLDLRLWGLDQGKMIRLRAPEAISRESFERFLQAFRLLVRVEEDGSKGTGSGQMPDGR
jgi:hypothetical protein